MMVWSRTKKDLENFNIILNKPILYFIFVENYAD